MADGAKVGSAYVEVTPKAAGNFANVLDGEISKGGDKGTLFGDAFSGGMQGAIGAGAVMVGNILADMAQAGAQKAADVIGDAFTGFADYEQLSGGIEKLFGDDAAQTVMDNASRAFQTAGLSANDYMEQVTSFSASLISSLDGDTETAANLADVAMANMSDNANTFGTDIQSIQNAYQGFAKGNFTMLDNLKLGYGGTKEEMERLLRDAEELEGMELGSLSTDNFADIVTALDIVQTEMNISGMSAETAAEMVAAGVMTEEEAFAAMGTTAREASQTVQGSMDTAQAAWENWVAALGNPDADMGQATDDLLSSLSTLADNALPVIEQVVSTISAELPGLVSAIGPILIPTAVDMVSSVVPAIVALAPSLLQAGMDLFLGLVQAAIVMLPIVAQTVIAAGPTLLAAGMEFFMQLGYALGQAAPMIIDAVVWLVTHLPEIVVQGAFSMLEAGANLFGGFVEGLLGIEPESTRAGTTVATAAVDAAAEAADATAAGEAFTETFADSFDFSSVERSATDAVQEATSSAAQSADGSAIAEQLSLTAAEGLDVGAMDASTAEMVQSAIDAALQTDASEIGANLSASAAEGIDTTALVGASTQVSGAYDSMASSITDSMSKSSGAAKQAGDEIRAAMDIPDKDVYVNVLPGSVSLPHFSMWGDFDPQTKSVPTVSVSWYAKGAIFEPNSPGLIGIGDAKVPEVAAPLDALRDMLGLGERQGGEAITVNLNYSAGADANRMARDLALAIERQQAARGRR